MPWTKPVDPPYDAKKPLPKLGGLFDHGINAAFADDSPRWLKKDFDAATTAHGHHSQWRGGPWSQ